MTDISLKELELQQMQNSKLKLNEVGKSAIKAYLKALEVSMLKQDLEPMITTKEIITELFQDIGGDPEETQHQMEVAKFIKSIGWNKKGKRTYRGKKDVMVHIKSHTSKKKEQRCDKAENTENKAFLTPSKKNQTKAKTKTATPRKKKKSKTATPNMTKTTANSTDIVICDKPIENQILDIDAVSDTDADLLLFDYLDNPITVNDEIIFSRDKTDTFFTEVVIAMSIWFPQLELNPKGRIVDTGKIVIDGEEKAFMVIKWANRQHSRLLANNCSKQPNASLFRFNQVERVELNEFNLTKN